MPKETSSNKRLVACEDGIRALQTRYNELAERTGRIEMSFRDHFLAEKVSKLERELMSSIAQANALLAELKKRSALSERLVSVLTTTVTEVTRELRIASEP